jgi:DNA repair protein RadA/Sms
MISASGFTCHACGAFFPVWPSNPCPECGRWNLIRPGKVDHIQKQLQGGAHPLGESAAPLARHSTGIRSLDLLLGGATHPGIVDGHAIFLVGSPGIGKTTLGLQLMARAVRPLFISAEQPESEIAARAAEMRLDVTKVMFSSDTELSAIEHAIGTTRATDAVVDSLSCLWDKKRASPPGGAWMMKEAARRLFEIAHATRTTLWIIGHINKKGHASGPMSAVHWTDVLLQYEAQADEAQTRRLYFPLPRKNRGGPTLGAAYFRMTEAEGLVPMLQEEVTQGEAS